LIKFDIFEEKFQEFNIAYETLIEVLTNTKFNLTMIKEYYRIYENTHNKENAKYLVANFGAPNNRKSSAFNFLMTGSNEFPLPTSGRTDVEGETLKPIRCRYATKSNNLIIKKNSQNETIGIFENFDTIDDRKAIISFLRHKMKENNIQEISIELPSSKFKKQYDQLKKFEFLDLIGCTPKMSSSSIDLNRFAIEKEQVDAIFIFHGGRQEIPEEVIKQLWNTGIFSDLSERRVPKLINAMKIKKSDWTDKQGLEDKFSGFIGSESKTRLELQKTICELFNFFDIDHLKDDLHRFKELKEYLKDKDQSKLSFLEIENKFKSATELLRRADSVCIMELDNENSEDFEIDFNNKYLITFTSIKDDIICSKNDLLCREALQYLHSISKEILKKSETYVKSVELKMSNKHYGTIINKIKNDRRKRNANKTVKDHCNSFKNEIQNFLLEDFVLEETVFRGLKLNNMIFSFTKDLARVLCDLKSEIADQIKKYTAVEFNKITNTEIEYFENIVKDYTKNYFDDFKNFVKLIEFKMSSGEIISKIESEEQLKQRFENLTEKSVDLLNETLYESFYIEITNESTKKSINQSISDLTNGKICQMKKINDDIAVMLKIENIKDEGIIEEDYYPKPIIFKKNGSNNLPKEAKTIEIIEIPKYIKSKNFTKDKPDEDLLNEGKDKSKLKIEYKACEQKEFVQFEIDRKNCKVIAEFNQPFIRNKVDNLLKNIYEFEINANQKSLYPIFISSRLRKRDKDSDYIEMNIIAKDLLADGLKKENFLIFLFIQAGTEKTRDQFANEINYYKKLKYMNCPCRDDSDCPIILCYLPEVLFLF
jgi:hypothetical protein